MQELTAYENILLPVLLDRRKPDKKHVSMLVEMLGIGDRLDHLPSALSGGQQQRPSPGLWPINPPSSLRTSPGNLDGKSAEKCWLCLNMPAGSWA